MPTRPGALSPPASATAHTVTSASSRSLHGCNGHGTVATTSQRRSITRGERPAMQHGTGQHAAYNMARGVQTPSMRCCRHAPHVHLASTSSGVTAETEAGMSVLSPAHGTAGTHTVLRSPAKVPKEGLHRLWPTRTGRRARRVRKRNGNMRRDERARVPSATPHAGAHLQ